MMDEVLCHFLVYRELTKVEIEAIENEKVTFLCQLTCYSADIMGSLCSVSVHVSIRVCGHTSKFS